MTFFGAIGWIGSVVFRRLTDVSVRIEIIGRRSHKVEQLITANLGHNRSHKSQRDRANDHSGFQISQVHPNSTDH